ncbi:MAG: S41 family peptidase [Candidatus Omnitrophota bacterium]
MMSQKKINPVLWVLLFSTFLLFNNNPAFAGVKSVKDELYEQIEIFSDALTAVQHDYVEEIQTKDVIYGALKGMLAALDPYSQFMDPDIFKELQVETEGEFGGLGIEITLRDNLLTIIAPLDGTPADLAGLKSLDRIVKIDGEVTKDITLTEAVKKLRGKPGSEVTITILRESEDEIKDYTIKRDIIQIQSVRRAEIIENNTGYIKLTDFSEKTKSDLDKALEKLEKEGMDSLILDLRNNPGGLLVSSVETVSEFLPTGKLIVYTKGRDKRQNVEYRATGKTNFKNIPLIVLINGGSASASEIVAGAIQDHKRGIILGTKSFGKGSVQTVIPLRDGSALRLTTAKYYTPTGRTINEDGIKPDVLVEWIEPKDKDIEAKKEKEENVFDQLKETETQKNIQDQQDKSAPQPEPTKQEEDKKKPDNQLRAALNLMRGIKIYKQQSEAPEKKE